MQRVNDSVLGGLERPALAWLARRLPRAVVPNHLTALAALGAALAGAGFVLSTHSLTWLWMASLGLLLHWLGDSLDGTLARLRHIERPRFGFFIDHTSDLFSQSVIFITLGISPLTRFGIACLGLIAFLIAFVYTMVAAQTRGTLRITYLHFGPTEMRALLLAGNLITLKAGIVDLRNYLPLPVTLGAVSMHDGVIALLAASAIAAVLLTAMRDAQQLAAEDPPRT